MNREFTKTMRIDLIPNMSGNRADSQQGVIVGPADVAACPLERADGKATPRSPYKELLQSIYDAVIVTSPSGRIVDVNQRAEEFFLLPAVQFCSLSVFDVMSGADASLMQKLRENLEIQRYALIQAYCLRRDATTFPAEIAVNELNLSNTPHFCFFVRDVTARRQTEEMLWTEHNALQNSGSAIAVADPNACLEYANPAMAAMWGYDDAEELQGVDIKALLADAVAADSMINAVLISQRSWVGKMEARRRDGSTFSVQISAACNPVSDGQLAGVVISFVDITDRLRVEQAVREAEKHRVMLESLGAACHHLGQPATVLLANLELMEEVLAGHGKGNGELPDLVKGSVDAAQKLGRILHKLNSVNEYRTTTYTEHDASEDLPESRILDI